MKCLVFSMPNLGVFCNKYLTIIGQGWGKCFDLSVAGRSVMCRSQRLRKIVDLRGTDKSQYFVLTEFNINCFITLSLSLFFSNYLQSDVPFSRNSNCKKEKSVVSFMYEQNVICSQTQLENIKHEQTIICKQLFAGHIMGSRPVKRKKNLYWMIITFHLWLQWNSSLEPRYLVNDVFFVLNSFIFVK